MPCSSSPAPDFCPTAEQLVGQYLMLLPRGRAWGEGGPGRLAGGVIYGFLYFCAIVMAAYHAAICALIPELFCYSADVTAAWWLEEYGLPDDCDPYPSPCAKIAAVGGATCYNLVVLAAGIGWSISCFAGPDPGSIIIVVSLAGSIAYSGGTQTTGMRVAGCYQAGQRLACGSDITPLDCLLQRVVHAHVTIEYLYS